MFPYSLSVPIEMEMMKREHFNRWYNLVPYFLSVVTFEIPFQVRFQLNFDHSLPAVLIAFLLQILCASTYLTISFWLTGNYQENWRFSYFMLLVRETINQKAFNYLI